MDSIELIPTKLYMIAEDYRALSEHRGLIVSFCGLKRVEEWNNEEYAMVRRWYPNRTLGPTFLVSIEALVKKPS